MHSTREYSENNHRIVTVNEMQFGFMLERGTVDAENATKMLYMCFVDLEKAFDRVQRKEFEWAMVSPTSEGGQIHLNPAAI